MGVRTVFFAYHPTRPASRDAAARGKRWCAQHGIYAEVNPLGGGIPERVDLVVAIGGDGTLLRAAAAIYPREVPILAVNVGGLGFLTACEEERLEEGLEEFSAGRAWVERRFRLRAELEGKFLGTALNEVALTGQAGIRAVRYSVEVGKEKAMNMSGDGLVVATPTGSTAYALAAGGPVVEPHVDGIVIVPLAPHRLGSRPVVVPGEAEVGVLAESPLTVFLDGEEAARLKPGEAAHIAKAPGATCLVRLAEADFFARLREKLGWPE